LSLPNKASASQIPNMVTPLGRWSGFESGRALTSCRQSQRKCHKFSAKESRQSVTPLGRWSGFESRRALTYCRQSQRKHHKFKGRRQGVRSVIPLGPWKKVREGWDHRHSEKRALLGGFKFCGVLTYSAVLPVMLQPWACRVPPFM
jgi:hypothetical protein